MNTEQKQTLLKVAEDVEKALTNAVLVLADVASDVQPESEDGREIYSVREYVSRVLDDTTGYKNSLVATVDNDLYESGVDDSASQKDHSHNETPNPEGFWQGVSF